MRVQILKWIYSGIRGVNNLEIDVIKKGSTPYQSSLIMMPNGTGKTTTITLLRAIFDGKADTWKSERVKEFDPKIIGVSSGKFAVQLSIDHDLYWIELHLNYQTGQAWYKTSRGGINGGLESGHHFPEAVKSVFTKEFVKRFVFDGELAHKILESKSDEAEKAIKFLYHIDRMGETRKKIEGIVEEQQKRNSKTSTKTENGLRKIRDSVSSLDSTLKRMEVEVEGKEKLLASKKMRLVQIEEQVTDSIKADQDLNVLAQKLEKEKNETLNEVKDKTAKLLEDMRNPNLLSPAIATRLTSLSDKMQQLKLPKTMSRQFFEELAEQENCVCGRTISGAEKNKIITNSQDYLAEDQIGVINSIKSAVRDRHYDPRLSNDVTQLKGLVKEKYRISNDWERLQLNREESGDVELQKIRTEKQELERHIEQLEKELEIYTTNNRGLLLKLNVPHTQNIILCEQKLEEEKKKLAEATNTLMYLNASRKINNYLNQVEKRALDKLKNKIKDQTNEKLAKIIRTEQIQVQEIDRHLILKNKSGTSVGQSLAIAYSYLGSMFHESTHQLPFIVDSPAGALDLNVRREVSKILPDLFDQMIIFITSGERDGFTEHFYSLEDNVQFLTINKQINGDVKCTEGVTYFKSFQETIAQV